MGAQPLDSNEARKLLAQCLKQHHPTATTPEDDSESPPPPFPQWMVDAVVIASGGASSFVTPSPQPHITFPGSVS